MNAPEGQARPSSSAPTERGAQRREAKSTLKTEEVDAGSSERGGRRKGRWGSGVRNYLLVVGAVGAATVLRWALDPVVGEALPFVTYYVAVAVAALVGGARAGVMATAVSALAVNVFFQEPRGSLSVGTPTDWVALGLFGLVGGLVSWMAGRVDRARRREAEALERKRGEEALRKSEERYRSLFKHMLGGSAYCRLIYENGSPRDFIYLDVNDAFERLTGLKDVVGKKVSEVIPSIHQTNPELLETYGRVALSGQSERFETYLERLGIWFSISVYSPRGEHFVAVFDNITERKRAEEALRREEEEVRNVALFPEENPFPVLRAAADGTVLYGNGAAGGLLAEWKCGIGGRAPELVREAVRKGVESGAAQELEVRLGERILSFVLVPIVARGYVNLYGRDITERRQAEEAVGAAHAKTERILGSITDGFVAVDPGWRFTYANGEAERLLRRRGSELLGADVWELFPGAEAFRERYEEAVRSRRAVHFEEFYSPLKAWFEVHAYPSGEGLSVFFRDVTERRRAEEKLRESEERFRTMADGTPLIIWVADAEGRNRFVNRAFCEFFGVEGHEVLDFGWQALLHPEDRPEYVEAFLTAVRERKPFRAQARVRRHDGVWRWIDSYGKPRFSAGGEYLGMAGSSPDVTERKEFQAELERLVAERTAKLHELVGELEHFSYTITHDLKSPLRAMRGFAELAGVMSESGEKGKAKEFLGRISTSAERMDRLIADALSYSRSVRQELPLEDVDAGALLRGMLDSYPELQPERAEIRVEGGLPVVLANEAGLTQCFSNLLGNAVKFVQAGEKPKIRLWASQRGEWVRIWVEDKGIGISKEMLPRVFEMFARGNKEFEGTGIGLALVRKVVQRMGGRVGVESEEGKGSRFWIELSCGEAKASRGQTAGPVVTRGGEGAVLYVEDEESDAIFMERAFDAKGLGGKLRLLGSGRAAIDYLSGSGQFGDREKYPVPALVLLDLNLPQVSGFRVLEWMRNHPDYARMPVVVFSSSTREDDRVKARELGADEFLAKPSSGLKFGEVVEGLMAKWMGRRRGG